MSTTLFKNQTSNGDSPNFDDDIRGGSFNLKATGNFDGAIITLNVDFRDNDFAPIVSDNIAQTITAPGLNSIILLKIGTRLKATLSSAGGSTDVTLKIL